MKLKARMITIPACLVCCACIAAYAATAVTTQKTSATGNAPQLEAADDLENTLEQKVKAKELKAEQQRAEREKPLEIGPDAKRKELPAAQPSLTPEQATDTSIVIVKSERTLYLYNGSKVIAKYSVGIGKVEGDKQREGDHKTPEGTFYVCTKNSQSKFHLSLGLSYPAVEDAKRGYRDGLISAGDRDRIISAINAGEEPDWYTALGGCIMIHGQMGNLGGQSDWSAGCITVNNAVIDILWQYAQKGMKVTVKA